VKDGVVGRRSRNYPAELRERAVRMVAEVRLDYLSLWAARETVAGDHDGGSRCWSPTVVANKRDTKRTNQLARHVEHGRNRRSRAALTIAMILW
jgi:transposase-like protein